MISTRSYLTNDELARMAQRLVNAGFTPDEAADLLAVNRDDVAVQVASSSPAASTFREPTQRTLTRATGVRHVRIKQGPGEQRLDRPHAGAYPADGPHLWESPDTAADRRRTRARPP